MRHSPRRQAAEVPAERWRGQSGQHFDDRQVLFAAGLLGTAACPPRSGRMHARLISYLTGSQSGCLSLLLAASLSEAGIGAERVPCQGWANCGLGEAATEWAHGLCVNGDCASS